MKYFTKYFTKYFAPKKWHEFFFATLGLELDGVDRQKRLEIFVVDRHQRMSRVDSRWITWHGTAGLEACGDLHLGSSVATDHRRRSVIHLYSVNWPVRYQFSLCITCITQQHEWAVCLLTCQITPAQDYTSDRVTSLAHAYTAPYRVAIKLAHFVLYALTSSNIDRFPNLFHCQNQENVCDNTVT